MFMFFYQVFVKSLHQQIENYVIFPFSFHFSSTFSCSIFFFGKFSDICSEFFFFFGIIFLIFHFLIFNFSSKISSFFSSVFKIPSENSSYFTLYETDKKLFRHFHSTHIKKSIEKQFPFIEIHFSFHLSHQFLRDWQKCMWEAFYINFVFFFLFFFMFFIIFTILFVLQNNFIILRNL